MWTAPIRRWQKTHATGGNHGTTAPGSRASGSATTMAGVGAVPGRWRHGHHGVLPGPGGLAAAGLDAEAGAVPGPELLGRSRDPGRRATAPAPPAKAVVLTGGEPVRLRQRRRHLLRRARRAPPGAVPRAGGPALPVPLPDPDGRAAAAGAPADSEGGAGLLSWLFLIGPLASDAQRSALVKMASVAYPAADLLVFAVAVRLLVGPGTRPASYRLLSASLLVVLATDTVYVLMQLTGTYTTGNVLDASWLGSYVLLGAAALHPSMRVLSEPSETPRTHTSRWRLGLLAVASLVAPATLVIPTTLGRAVNLPVIAGASAVLFLLVVARLGGLVDEQRRAAVTDALTGLYNRRFFEATLALEAEHAVRSGRDLGLLVLDIDHFKRINDAHGHQAGDRVLRELAARLVASIRGGDVIARYGGEEFVVLLRNTSVEAVPETAKRLGRDRIQIGRPPGGTAVVQERDEDAVLAYLERLADEIDARLASEEHSAAIARWAGTIA